MSFLPLTNNPEELFNTTIFDIVYSMRQLWNTLGFWTIDIRDSSNDALLLGVKLVTKTNLLSQHPHIPFDLRSESVDDPSRNNLDTFNLSVVEKDV